MSPPQHDDLVSYTWDARNRLTGAEDFSWSAASSSWVETEAITYTYDVFDHLIERLDDVVGSGTTTTQYVWDASTVGNALSGVPQGESGVILAFTNGSLSSRYLNGPNTSTYDQYFSTLAEENVGTGATTWDLLGPKGSVRDVIDGNGNVVDHLSYNSFGQVAYESVPSVSHIDGYSGGLYDPSTQLVYFIHRWYDPMATVWISADPMGFAAGDANLTRYVRNNATNEADPTGLQQPGSFKWGGNPRTPFALPASDRARAERWLINLGATQPTRGGGPTFFMPRRIPTSEEKRLDFPDFVRLRKMTAAQAQAVADLGCEGLALFELRIMHVSSPNQSDYGIARGWASAWSAPSAVLFLNETDALRYAQQIHSPLVFAYQSTDKPVNAATPGFTPVAAGQIDPATIPIEGGEKNVATYHVGPKGAYWQMMDHSHQPSLGSIGHVKQRKSLPPHSGGVTNIPFYTTVYGVLRYGAPWPVPRMRKLAVQGCGTVMPWQ